MKNQEYKFKIYSVESRKGGVGKTTMALTLAKLLVNAGHPVLLLDCDITGTSIAPPARNSSFWNNITNVLTNDKGEDINLLDYYLSNYLKGKADISALLPKDKIEKKKANVIGSSVYDGSEASYADVRLLMDEIHSYWLVEYVFEIACKFAEINSGEDVVVIIDNSPGYVGFNKALHLEMAKMGPERAKFLMVSSFDEQDLQSCISASKNIESMVVDRIRIAEYFDSLALDDKLNPELEQKMKEQPGLKQFFFNLVDEGSSYPRIDRNNLDVRNYLSLVLNKVPEEVGIDGFQYMYDKVAKDKNRDLFNSISAVGKDGQPKAIINYDRNIALQFYSSLIVPREEDGKYNWSSRFVIARKRNLEELVNIEDPAERVKKVQDSYASLLNSMSQKGYKRFASYLPEEWQPSYALDGLSNMVASFGTHDYIVEPLINAGVEKEDIYEAIVSQLQLLAESIGQKENESIFLSILNIIAKRVGYGNERIVKPTRLVILYLMIRAFAELTKKDFAEQRDFRLYLINGGLISRLRIDWHKLLGEQIHIIDGLDINTTEVRDVLNSLFPTFYNKLCNTILKVIDVNLDYEFLIQTFELFIPYKNVMFMSKEIKKYVSEVVVQKTKLWNVAELRKMWQQMADMNSLEKVLKQTTLTAWR